jgi:hypothetical protein
LASTGGVDLGQTTALIITLVMTFLILVGYPIAMETSGTVERSARRRWACAPSRARVADPVSPRRDPRHLRLVEVWIFRFDRIVSMVCTTRNQRVGDLVAGTIVLRAFGAAGPGVAVSFRRRRATRPIRRIARRHPALGRAVLDHP